MTSKTRCGAPNPPAPAPLCCQPEGLAFEELEHSVLQQALSASQGNRAQAAKLLKMSYKAFLYRLQKHGIGDH